MDVRGTFIIIWFQYFLFLFGSPLLTSVSGKKILTNSIACANDILAKRGNMFLLGRK